MAPKRKYAAFISYRHVSPDKQIAKEQQVRVTRANACADEKLERILLPIPHGSSENQRGNPGCVPSCLHPAAG